MRWSWFLLLIITVIGGTLSAAESGTPPPPTKPTESVNVEKAPVAAAVTEEKKSTPNIYAQHRLANNLVAVVVSELQGSIRSMSLINEEPVHYRKWQRQALIAQGKQPPEPDQPLAILDDFKTGAGKHNWISGLGLPGSNPAWKIISQDENNLVLGYTNNETQISYRLAYFLPKDALSLRSTLTVQNGSAADLSLLPHIYPLNGVHQDDLKQDAAYLALVYHTGGPDGKMQSLSLPPVGGEPSKIVSEQLDYVALKSRFFAALWQPISFRVSDINEKNDAPTTTKPAVTNEAGGPATEAGGPGTATPVPSAGPRGNMWVAGVGYLDRNKAHQAFIDVAYYGPSNDEIIIKPNQKMEIVWTLTVASMKKSHVERLSDIAAKVEYSDGYYRFFKSLAWLITISLDALVLFVVNYGLALVVLTLLIKLLLHRTTFKQHESMMKMQKLAPDLKLLQETYKNDKQKLAQKQMELWKKHGVNPLGGCLPILIQIPIFTALYLAFCHSADMRGHGFLWVNDLTLPDQLIGWMVGGWTISINPLPLIYIGVSIWMSMMQKMPEGGDPQQAQMMKMMRWLPVVFGVIFYNFPSGLVLYFTVNAVLSTIEIKMVRKKLGMK